MQPSLEDTLIHSSTTTRAGYRTHNCRFTIQDPEPSVKPSMTSQLINAHTLYISQKQMHISQKRISHMQKLPMKEGILNVQLDE